MKMRPWQKASMVVLSALVLIYVGIAAVARFGIAYFIEPKLQEMNSRITSHQEKILADLRLLDANPIFTDSPRVSDAQPFISRYIGWEGKNQDLLANPEQKELLALKANHRSHYTAKGLLDLDADPSVSKVDVTWVDELEKYDHWYLASNALVKSEFDKAKVLNGIGRIGVIASIPMPNFELLRFASLVRFLQLKKKGEALKGLRLIRQVSYLAHTTHTLVGSAFAAAGLKAEHTIAETFDIKNSQLIEKERVAIYRRLSWAWGAVMYQTTFNRFPAEFEAFLKPRNGVCAFVGENASSLGLYDFLAPTLPLEPDYSDEIARSVDLSRKLFALCSMKEFDFMLEPAPGANPVFMTSADGSNVQTGSISGVNLARIPFVRRGFGLAFLTIATPNFLGQYEDLLGDKK